MKHDYNSLSMNILARPVQSFLALILSAVLLSQSVLALPNTTTERARTYTRMIEFDFIDWTIDALMVKIQQEALHAPRYMTVDEQRAIVFEYMRLVNLVNVTTFEVQRIYADPEVADSAAAAAKLNQQLDEYREMEMHAKLLAESVLQYQVSEILATLSLGLGGQPVPPVLYHVTRLPDALIISPRGEIRQDANISLNPEMSPEEIVALEQNVETNLDVSALVVPVGGIGTYPTMVMSTTNLNWMVETIAHEWVHNFLTLRPLGLNYATTPELRTINETTANLAGVEIGEAVIRAYYPELAPVPLEEQPVQPEPEQPQSEPEIPVFEFRREMRETRLQVDAYLAEGNIEQAEQYMQERQVFFLENGYFIRRLNQAYFAFYGAYNDTPGGGAAGEDPVGPAVQALRQQSGSLAEFLNRISWITSFEGLLEAVEQQPGS